MKIPFLGVNVDARIVALVRGVVIAAVLAGLAAAQAALTDPSYQEFAWVPIAAYILRQLEGFIDHADDERPG
jgi:hypothetical protein